ncbi:hypothetical protein QT970_03515 [Microcoleus sp. herbarium8]|uniref:hypothetical protein n=1 Tax=Microcoleus sp. herbarium8 TaxID=3055436 RepID=UPI002FD37535
MNQQLAFSFDRNDEAAAYHDTTRWGFFSLLYGPDRVQDSYRLDLMPQVLDLLDPRQDSWLSQAEFTKPNRRVVNLARIGLLFADLDTYRLPGHAEKSPEQLAAGLLYYCRQEGIPVPSLIVFSGQGLQAKWLLKGTVPRAALPRWNAVQRHLIDRLSEWGADRAAKDASRVLRLVETTNCKTGQICRVVHVENENAQPLRYCFEYLAEALLPVARWDIEAYKKARKLKVIDGGTKSKLRTFNGRTLAWDRLEDLRKLAELRGGVKKGERMQHLFWNLNFLLLSGATHAGQMHHEAVALAHEIDPAWNHRTPELSTLYCKAKAYAAGERIEFGGRKFLPLYTPKNDTLISLFGITTDEERQLKTIISKSTAKRRDAERDTARRRERGAVEREQYETNSASRTKPWEALGMSRRTWYRAGKPSPPERGTSPSVLLMAKPSACGASFASGPSGRTILLPGTGVAPSIINASSPARPEAAQGAKRPEETRGAAGNLNLRL